MSRTDTHAASTCGHALSLVHRQRQAKHCHRTHVCVKVQRAPACCWHSGTHTRSRDGWQVCHAMPVIAHACVTQCAARCWHPAATMAWQSNCKTRHMSLFARTITRHASKHPVTPRDKTRTRTSGNEEAVDRHVEKVETDWPQHIGTDERHGQQTRARAQLISIVSFALIEPCGFACVHHPVRVRWRSCPWSFAAGAQSCGEAARASLSSPGCWRGTAAARLPTCS